MPGSRWKAPPASCGAPQPADVLIDAMRGRYTWTRIRVNLQHVPGLRPNQEPLDPDEKILSSS